MGYGGRCEQLQEAAGIEEVIVSSKGHEKQVQSLAMTGPKRARREHKNTRDMFEDRLAQSGTPPIKSRRPHENRGRRL